jgi:hypothetical protein
VPSAPPAVSRRRVLFGAAALALLGATAAACGSAPPPPELDDLVAQLDRARSDSQLAAAAAAAANPQIAPALTAVASERSAHARALTDEIARASGEATPTSTSTPTPTPTPTTSTSTSPPSAPTTQDVIGTLRASADSAGQLAAKLSGYRAGLLGSIAASCTAAYTVALVPPEQTP